jgi:hypothetical protein
MADAPALRAHAAPDVRWLEERTGEWKLGVDGLIESARASAEGTTNFSSSTSTRSGCRRRASLPDAPAPGR